MTKYLAPKGTVVAPKFEQEIQDTMLQMRRTDIMWVMKDLRELLMSWCKLGAKKTISKSQANGIIRAARKRNGNFYGKTAYTKKYGSLA